MDAFAAVCGPGLESLVASELRGLGLLDPGSVLRPPKPGSASAAFSGPLTAAYRANLHLRCADRVLVKAGEFYASTFPEFCRKASRIPWEKFLNPGQPIAFKVDSVKSRLYHEAAVAQRLAEAIEGRLRSPCPVGKFKEEASARPPQLITARVEKNLVSIGVDSSGEPLHRRGYRLASAKAPIRETLASALVLASGWDLASPLIDPFCGSGTIVIEAALMARKAAAGMTRKFAFMDWPGFDARAWDAMLADAGKWAVPAAPKILASDRDAGAVEAARANAERAGVAGAIEFSCRAVSAIEPPAGPGWVVTNPPYGVRLGKSPDLRGLYAALGDILRDKCPGWQVTMLSGSAQLTRATGLRLDCGIATMNGGLAVNLASGQV